MRCHNCGNQIRQGQVFCERCGAQVGAQSDPRYYSSWSDAEPVSGYDYDYDYDHDYGYGYESAACNRSSGSTATTVIIGIVVGLVCLMMILFGVFLLKSKDIFADATTQPTTETEQDSDSKTEVNVGEVNLNHDAGSSQDTTQVEHVCYYDPYFADSDAEYYAPDAPEFFWDSSDRYLSVDEVCYLDDKMLQRAINDIYARNGLIFRTARYQNYYESQCWYYGDTRSQDVARSRMNDFEVRNIELLDSYQ